MTWYDYKELVVQAAQTVPEQPEFDPVDLDDEAIRIVNDYVTIGWYIPRALAADELAESELADEAYDYTSIDEPDGRTEAVVAGVNRVADIVSQI
jgi:hypothetical protein